MEFLYPTFHLEHREYAKIISEINTNYGKYKSIPFPTHVSYGIDNRPYVYWLENHGFNDYNIYMKTPVDL